MRRLLSAAPPPDGRPAILFSWVALLLLLLPALLLTTSPSKLAAIDLHLVADAPGPAAVGPVEDLEIRVGAADVVVTARVRRTDVLASAGDAEERTFTVPRGAEGVDAAALSGVLANVRALDPARTRARVVPDDAMTTAQVVALLDVVRGSTTHPLFADVEIGG